MLDSPQPGPELSSTEKTVWFIAGFVGWFVVQVVLGALSFFLPFGLFTFGSDPNSPVNTIYSVLSLILCGMPILLTIGALIGLAFFPRGRWAALGILAAVAAAMCLVLIAGVATAAICFGSIPTN